MQTVLGLVIHRFDIHIKRETGCFDVRGERVPGDCWSSTLFFTDTAQIGVRGWGALVGEQIVADRVYRSPERQWVGRSDYTPPFYLCQILEDYPWSSCPDAYHQHSIHTHLLTRPPLLLYASIVPVLKGPNQKPGLQLSALETPDGWMNQVHRGVWESVCLFLK